MVDGRNRTRVVPLDLGDESRPYRLGSCLGAWARGDDLLEAVPPLGHRLDARVHGNAQRAAREGLDRPLRAPLPRPRARRRDEQLIALAPRLIKRRPVRRRKPLVKEEPEVGIEPTTYRLQGQRTMAILLSSSGYAPPGSGGCASRAPGRAILVPRVVPRRWGSRPQDSLSMKTGAGARANLLFFPGRLVGGGRVAVGEERVQVERPQPRSGEDDDLDARGSGGTMEAPGNRPFPRPRWVVVGLGVWEPRSSLYRRLKGGPGGMGGASLR